VLLKEVDDKLDMRCTIKVDLYDSIFNLTRSFNLRVPLFISNENDTYFARAYFSQRFAIPGLNEALAYFGAKQSPGRLELVNKIGNKKLVEILGPIIDIPSTSTLRVTAEKGKIVVRFRFHHNFSKEVSETISSAIETLSASVRIGTPSSIKSLLQWYNERIEPISMQSHIYPLKSVNDELLIEYLKKGIIELSYSPISQNRKFLFYLFSEPEKSWDLGIISKDSGIYETRIDSEFVNGIWEGITQKSISRIYTFFKLQGDGIKVITFLPTEELNFYVKALLETGTKLDAKPEMNIMNNYTSEIWEYL